MARRGAAYAPSVTAQRGVNLHGWGLAPVLSREVYGKVVAPYFDRESGKWDQVEVETGLESDAVLKLTPPADDKADAERQASARAETSKRNAGGGSVTIEGSTDAIPDGTCIVSGARAGIDGPYRITSVSHTVSASGGWVTDLELGHPAGASGAQT